MTTYINVYTTFMYDVDIIRNLNTFMTRHSGDCQFLLGRKIRNRLKNYENVFYEIPTKTDHMQIKGDIKLDNN